jgi:hypothetical protein
VFCNSSLRTGRPDSHARTLELSSDDRKGVAIGADFRNTTQLTLLERRRDEAKKYNDVTIFILGSLGTDVNIEIALA